MRLKIGFIGVGGMGQAAHLRNYASLQEECEVVACADLYPELSRAVASRYDIPRHYGTGADLLEHEEVDAIVASQPFNRHGILIPEMARKGVPIFVEKPIASSVQVGERILRELEKASVWTMVGYHKRSDPATVYAKQEIDRLKATKELGAMTYVRLAMPPGDWIAGGFNDLVKETHNRPNLGELEKDPAPEDMDAATYGYYDYFVNYYIHQVNLMRHLLGEDYAVTYADPAKVLLVGRSVSGVPCTIEMGAYTTSIDWQESALVAFEKGYVKLELPAPVAYNRPGRVELMREGTPPMVLHPQLPWVHAMRNQAMNFLKAVRGEAPAPCLAPEALEDLKIARDYVRLLGA